MKHTSTKVLRGLSVMPTREDLLLLEDLRQVKILPKDEATRWDEWAASGYKGRGPSTIYVSIR